MAGKSRKKNSSAASRKNTVSTESYKNKIVTKLINNIMLDGKKGVAQKIVYGAFEQVAEQTGKDALEVLYKLKEKLD